MGRLSDAELRQRLTGPKRVRHYAQATAREGARWLLGALLGSAPRRSRCH
jgi:hypothetical protein